MWTRFSVALPLLFFMPSRLEASVTPIIDDRYLLSCGGGNKIVPDNPFSPFNVSLGPSSGCVGSASQNSSITISNGSMTGFLGQMSTEAAGRDTTDLISNFALTFSLDTEYFYTTSIDLSGTSGGSSNDYRLTLSGEFLEQGFLNTQVLTFSKSGVLHPGEYRFELFIESFHSSRGFPVYSQTSTDFSFNLFPTEIGTPVPEGEVPLWPLLAFVPALALWSYRLQSKRGPTRPSQGP